MKNKNWSNEINMMLTTKILSKTLFHLPNISVNKENKYYFSVLWQTFQNRSFIINKNGSHLHMHSLSILKHIFAAEYDGDYY